MYTYPTINQDRPILWCFVFGLVILSNFAKVLILPWVIQIIVSRFTWSAALRHNGSWSVDNDARSGSFFQALHTPPMLKHQPLSCLMHPHPSFPCPDDKKYLDHNQPKISPTVFLLSLTHYQKWAMIAHYDSIVFRTAIKGQFLILVYIDSSSITLLWKISEKEKKNTTTTYT